MEDFTVSQAIERLSKAKTISSATAAKYLIGALAAPDVITMYATISDTVSFGDWRREHEEEDVEVPFDYWLTDHAKSRDPRWSTDVPSGGWAHFPNSYFETREVATAKKFTARYPSWGWIPAADDETVTFTRQICEGRLRAIDVDRLTRNPKLPGYWRALNRSPRQVSGPASSLPVRNMRAEVVLLALRSPEAFSEALAENSLAGFLVPRLDGVEEKAIVQLAEDVQRLRLKELQTGPAPLN